MNHLFEIPLWRAATVNATAALTSPGIDLRFMERIEGIRIRAVSATGDADVKLEWATGELPRGPEGYPILAAGQDEAAQAAYGGFDDQDDLLASSNTDFAANKEGYHNLAVPTFAASFVKFRVTGVGLNPADTALDVILICRE